MSVKIIQERLNSYNCRSAQEEENAIREITQEIALSALARAGFFEKAAFQGGTALRVFYGMERFSEDLDFILQKPQADFDLNVYLKNLRLEFEAYGYQMEVIDRSRASETVKKGFLKDDSLVKILSLGHLKPDRSARKIVVKLEVDTNPPAGSGFENKFLDFPFPVPVTVQDLPSLFAGKSHALLCREYVKGRDWYDFIWYAARRTPLNLDFFSSAINQIGPWKDKKIAVDMGWYKEQFRKKIISVNWEEVKKDLSRFLKPRHLADIKSWNSAFFLEYLAKVPEA
jgi:hypothetical protein